MQLKYAAVMLPMGFILIPASSADSDPEQPPPPTPPRPGSVTMKLAAYAQQDDGGIEQVDEDASVFEAVILADQQFTETGTMNMRLLGDIVSAASIERAHNADWQALQGGASGNYRLGLGVGWAEHRDQIDWSVGIQGAVEYAYTSLGLSGGLSYALPNRNTTLSIGLQIFSDTVDVIRYDGSEDGSEARDTATLDLSWHQVLSPRDVLLIMLSQTEQSGFLSTSYNSVFSPSGESGEILPDSRSRTSLTTRWRHSLNMNAAAELGVRYYRDDWDVSAVTLDVRGSFYLMDRRLLLEPTYRLHLQDGARYYQETWDDPLPRYRTSDPDLGDFTGHMLGLQATVFGGTLFGRSYTWDMSASLYDRDNGLTMYWLTFGQKLEW